MQNRQAEQREDLLERLETANRAMAKRRREQVIQWLYEDDCPMPDKHSTFTDEKYPLESVSERDQKRAHESFVKIVGDYRKRHKMFYKDVADRLCIDEATLRRYREGKNKIPSEVCERLCALANVTMDELQGRGNPYNEILPTGTTTDYLLGAEVWTPEQVKELYLSADDDTKRAVTHALKSWLNEFIMESELDSMRARELLLKDAIREIVPREERM